MLKRLFLLITLGLLVSGCFMVPMALIGPAAGGFSTASLMQSGVTTTVSYMVKKGTGKTIAEHAYESLSGHGWKQSYFPENENNADKVAVLKSKRIKELQ